MSIRHIIFTVATDRFGYLEACFFIAFSAISTCSYFFQNDNIHDHKSSRNKQKIVVSIFCNWILWVWWEARTHFGDTVNSLRCEIRRSLCRININWNGALFFVVFQPLFLIDYKCCLEWFSFYSFTPNNILDCTPIIIGSGFHEQHPSRIFRNFANFQHAFAIVVRNFECGFSWIKEKSQHKHLFSIKWTF